MTSHVLGMPYILCMCVCVGALDSTTMSDDPSSSGLGVVCVGCFPRGVPGGACMPPLGYTQRLSMGGILGQRLEIFFLRFLLFLADFAIFSSFLN